MEYKRTKDKTIRTFGNTFILCCCIAVTLVFAHFEGISCIFNFLCGFFACESLISIISYIDEEKEEEDKKMMDMYNH